MRLREDDIKFVIDPMKPPSEYILVLPTDLISRELTFYGSTTSATLDLSRVNRIHGYEYIIDKTRSNAQLVRKSGYTPGTPLPFDEVSE